MDDSQQHTELQGIPSGAADQTVPPPPQRVPFFQRIDWLGFSVTSAIVFSIYLLSLAPEVTLEFSGILSTGAMYAGVPHPPGFPLWTVYAWLFTELLPFSNIAWRVAVSSAVAGALACGVVTLMVSRGSMIFLEGMRGFERLPAVGENWLRLVCGFVAGMAFGMDRVFWRQAVIVETAGLGMLLLAIVLCLLLRWIYAPDQERYLYAGFILFGLALTVWLSLIVAGPGLLFIILLKKPALGRDLLFAVVIGLGAALLTYSLGVLPEALANVIQIHWLWPAYLLAVIFFALICVIVALVTRRLLTQWRTALMAVLLAVLGFSFYFYSALASMTNPPMNWGYARTVEGFVHLVGRGQYEHPMPTANLGSLVTQTVWYASETTRDLGIIYLVPAAIPFFFLRRMEAIARVWLVGLLATFLFLSLFLLAMLNPPSERSAIQLTSLYFPPSHLVLALWAGHGLTFLGTVLGSRRATMA